MKKFNLNGSWKAEYFPHRDFETLESENVAFSNETILPEYRVEEGIHSVIYERTVEVPVLNDDERIYLKTGAAMRISSQISSVVE